MNGADLDGRGSGWLLFRAGAARRDAPVRLVCFHYAGSGASMFQNWAAAMPDAVDLMAVQLPGRESRLDEPLLSSMDQVAPPIVDALFPLLERPFAFFGHSTGALIGFEVARRLRRRGWPQPRLLIVSAQNAPDMRPPVIRHLLPDAEFIEVLRRCNGTPDAILGDPVWVELLLPRIRADGAVFETYRYERQPPLDCRIVAFAGTGDPLVSDEGIAGWARETRGGFERRIFVGDHFFIHSQEESVLAEINRELEPLLHEADFPSNHGWQTNDTVEHR